MNPLPFFFVGKSVTTARIDNYVNNKHNLLSQAIEKQDTKSVWYTKEHIQKLLEEIEHANGDGLRIYLGMYESEHQFAGQLCLLMVTTKEVSVGSAVIHQNTYLEDADDYGDRSELPRAIPAFGRKGDLTSQKPRDFNFGSPCPPICDEEG